MGNYHKGHYLMREAEEIDRMVRAHDKEARRIEKMTPKEREEHDKEWERKCRFKIVRLKGGFINLVRKRPDEPVDATGKTQTHSQQMLDYLKRVRAMRKKK